MVPFWYIYIFETQWFASANLSPDYISETMADLNIGHRWSFLILGSGSGFNIIPEKFDFYLLIAIIRVVIFLIFFLIIILLLCFVVYNCILHLGLSMLRSFVRLCVFGYRKVFHKVRLFNLIRIRLQFRARFISFIQFL